jgi:hypothetical protein
VANGVYSNQTYVNPSWIGSLLGSKITSAVGTATTVVNGIYNTDVGTVSNTMLAGGITNAKLSSSTITLNVSNGITVSQANPSLGGSTTIGFNTGTLVTTAVNVVGGIGVSTIAGSSGTQVSTSTGAVTVWFNTGTLVTTAVNVVGGIGVSTIVAGTGTTISTSTGAVTVWINTATATTLGGVKIDGGLTVVADGTISVNTSTLMARAVNATTATNLSTATSILAGVLSISPAQVAKNGSSTQTFTLPSLTTNHHITVTPAADQTYGIFISAAYPSGANTLSVQFQNFSGGNVTPATFNLSYFAWI